MQMQVLIDWISQTSLSERILNEFWVVPSVQAVHICAIAVVVGSALVSELRLVGVIATDETPVTVIKRYLPWMWGALVLLLLTGLILLWGEPGRTLLNWMFWLKMGLVFVGFVLTVLFPSVLPVPPSAQIPLSSTERSGTEYSDLAAAGYIEEEYYLSGHAPSITAAGETLFQAPYITRILVHKPQDPALFNGTVVI